MSGFAEGIRAGMALGSAVRQSWRDSKRDGELAAIESAEVKEEPMQGPFDKDGALPTGSMFSFLGKSFDKPLDDDAKQQARIAAKAGVLEKYGDVEGAERLRGNALGRKLTTLQIGGAERQAKRDKQADDDEEQSRAIDKDTTAELDARLTNPDGTRRPMSAEDSLWLGQLRATKYAQAGRLKDANALAKDNMASALNLIQTQNAERQNAIGILSGQVAAGDFSGLPAFYKRFVPDGAEITNIGRDPKSGDLILERKSIDGRALTPQKLSQQQVLTGLKAFSDPNAVADAAWRQHQMDATDRQIRNSERQTGIQAAEAKRKRDDAAAAQTAGVNLFRETNPNATPAQVEAVRTGVLPATPRADANAPAEVKLAQAYMNAGLAKDMAGALKMATTTKGDSPEKVRAEIYSNALRANMGNAEAAESATEKAMAYLFKDAPKPGAGGAPQAGAIVNGFRFKGGDPKVQANWEPVR